MNLYGGVGTENNHVNKYTPSSQVTASNNNCYGGMTYYSSETCGYVSGEAVTTDCKTSYAYSDIKYVVDGWANAKFQNDELKEVSNYKVRLIQYADLIRLKYNRPSLFKATNETPNWSYAYSY